MEVVHGDGEGRALFALVALAGQRCPCEFGDKERSEKMGVLLADEPL
jgi:hypothetical protein